MRITFFARLFSITILSIFCISTVPVHGQCLNHQSSLLLRLKNSLTFDSTISIKLVNWTQTDDCCHWKGVTCDEEGQVTGLDLNSESISGGINHSSSLFSLQFLRSLNLAYNNFNFTQIPPDFGNLTRLTYLNLSNANLAGQIPIQLSWMVTLVTLDLSTLYFSGVPSLKLENPNLSTLVQNLTELQELFLDGVNISARGSQWCGAISSSLPNLRVLSLSNCSLSGPIDSSLQKLRSLSEIRLVYNNLSAPVPNFFAYFLNLTSLHLSSCNLYGTFPEKIFQVSTLKTLHLIDNRLLQGSLPEFPPNSSLQTLVLSNTSFSGMLPDSIYNQRELSRIELSGCNFSGPIPSSISYLAQLVYLDLSYNNFTGPIPSFQMCKNFTYIGLSHNALTGLVPSTHFEGLSNLVNINLANNSFSGSVPSSLFSLPSLQKIELSYNQFGGQVTVFKNETMPSLDTLDLSRNKLEGPIPATFFEFQRLQILKLSFNNFNDTIELEMIQRLQNLMWLDLSYNNLSINVSDNKSSLSSFPQLRILNLASCKLRIFPELKNQPWMVYLDLSANEILGEIPNWIWKVGNGRLVHLNLSHNLLVDLEKPYIIPSLSILDLHFNKLSGQIPIPPGSVVYLDYSSNSFNSSLPSDIGNNLPLAAFISVSNNSLTGTIPQLICNASDLLVLDLSNNRFSGTVPQCLIENSTQTLGVLNLGNNYLTGKISGTFPEVCALTTLDFNGNHLEGQVPKSLANCAKLEVLNLGNNEINDRFPCFLKFSSGLRVLVLRSNRFQGGIHCGGNHSHNWPNLQIIDLALNNFSGDLPPKWFLHWKTMMVDEDNVQPKLSFLSFEFLNPSIFYYQDTVTVTSKGLQMSIVKILTIFKSIDFSCNSFKGKIPDSVGALRSLHVLNLSHNDLTGPIPSSVGNLENLESLDLSWNKLNGSIPTQLASLTFLSFLNLSYNQLFGMIPRGSQFQTFTETSFAGNKGLCGTPLNASCNDPEASGPSTPTYDDRHSNSDQAEIDWGLISATLGFSTGFAVVVGPLVYFKRWRKCYYKHVDRVILSFFHR